MTIRTPKQALADANSKTTNVVGACQAETRAYFMAPSVGDFDGDGAADAEDGWKSEPATAKRYDKLPPAGYPVAFLGGSHDNGHRAISLGGGLVRSTDFNGLTKEYHAGIRGNGTIDEVARAMGVTYAGWSTTIDGVPIPPDPKPTPAEKTKGWRVDKAEKLIKHAESKPGTKREKLLKRIAALLAKVPEHNKNN